MTNEERDKLRNTDIAEIFSDNKTGDLLQEISELVDAKVPFSEVWLKLEEANKLITERKTICDLIIQLPDEDPKFIMEVPGVRNTPFFWNMAEEFSRCVRLEIMLLLSFTQRIKERVGG